uniref:Uncharacterized protein n=1 Tax=Rhizophora mucronata TaxID=61149 RepID=A0A2P2PPR6_RHIMU
MHKVVIFTRHSLLGICSFQHFFYFLFSYL